MTTPEGYEKRDVKKYLTSLGAYQFWPVQTGRGKAGVDCYACINGDFVAIEVKRPGKEPTPRQDVTLGEVRAARGETFAGDAATIIEGIGQWLKFR